MDPIYDAFNKWLVMPNNDLLDLVAGVVLGNRLEGRPIFMVLVGPSGCGKSEVIEALTKNQYVTQISEISSNTFISGLRGKEQECSLLLRLERGKSHLFTFKDLTTILSDKWETKVKVLAQLREIYDGSFSKGTGSGRPNIVWTGKVGILAGCTGVFDEVSQKLASLGERYLVYRVPIADRTLIADAAGRSANQEQAMKAELTRAMQTLDSVAVHPVPVSYDVRQYLNMLCDFLAHMRTPVRRDPYNRHEILQIPEVESPARISRQLTQLIQGVTLARGEKEPGTAEVNLIDQVAISSIPSMRLRMIVNIPNSGVLPADLARATKIPTSTCYRLLEDMELLGLVRRDRRHSQGLPNVLRPAKDFKPFFGIARRIIRGD